MIKITDNRKLSSVKVFFDVNLGGPFILVSDKQLYFKLRKDASDMGDEYFPNAYDPNMGKVCMITGCAEVIFVDVEIIINAKNY